MKKQSTLMSTMNRNINTEIGTRISTTPCAMYLSLRLNYSFVDVPSSSDGSVSSRSQIIPIVVLAIRRIMRSAVSLVALLDEIESITGSLIVNAKIVY